ncbi:phage portal protein [Micrococcus luteus]|uniref:phage portal protein n=1 Tax=Micrococcus luteus TaxID=1270 RepID=UPI00203A6664|nr:phage portal protein [Micrococcus luteus]MCM3577444.1 phage portal protein [Micrococcus luteus]
MGVLQRVFGIGGDAAAVQAAYDRMFPDALPLATWEESEPLTRLTIEDLYGRPRLPWVTRSEALTVSSVAKGRQIIAGKIASFPLVAMQGTTTNNRPPTWATHPEAGRPRYQTILWTVDMMLFYGRAWWVVTDRYATGYPSRFRLVPEHNATIDTAGRLTHAFGEPVAAGDVVRIDGPHEGILHTSQKVLRQAVAIEDAASRAADNPVPSIELHQTNEAELTDKEIDALVAAWSAARRGANGGVAYTSQGIEARTHGQAAEQLLIAGRNTAALNVARVMGLSAWAVDASLDGSGASMNYQSVPARSRELVEYGLQPYMDAITARLSMPDVSPEGQWVRFDTTSLTRGTFKERMDGYKAAIDAGIYSREECRAMESNQPMEAR